MRLTSISLFSNGESVRTVPFQPGLNLIVDETPDERKLTGNNVGKTTLLRVVDYCLGSDGKDIFFDSEGGKEASSLRDFLLGKKYSARLDFVAIDSHAHWTQRTFDPTAPIDFDGTQYETTKEFVAVFTREVFGYAQGRPSGREIVGRFIRKNSWRMSHTIKCIHQSTTDAEYEVLNLFLFGIADTDLLTQKLRLKREVKRLDDRRKAIGHGMSKSRLSQSLSVVEKRISEKRAQLANHSTAQAHEKEMLRLAAIRGDMRKVKLEIASHEARRIASQKTIESLRQKHSTISVDVLKQLYENVAAHASELAADFDSYQQFHNTMLDRKVQFIEEALGTISRELNEAHDALVHSAAEERDILLRLDRMSSAAGADALQEELYALHTEKGSLYEQRAALAKAESAHKNKKKEYSAVAEKIDDLLTAVEDELTIFNGYFSDYSELMYGEQFILSQETRADTIRFAITNVTQNPGSGLKKGEIAAYDLAFLQYLEHRGSRLPRFVLHDSLEDVHLNQVETIFEIAQASTGQFIVSLLADKLTKTERQVDFADCVRVRLSQGDKFFRAEAQGYTRNET